MVEFVDFLILNIKSQVWLYLDPHGGVTHFWSWVCQMTTPELPSGAAQDARNLRSGMVPS